MSAKKPCSLLFILPVLALLLPTFAWATYPAEVARTGQTTCYNASGTVVDCAGTGQDGDMLAGAPWPSLRFTNNGDGTVTDSLTGLAWTQNANLSNGGKTWTEALLYVAGMNAGTYPNSGYTDWRLPNVNELESLLNAQLYNSALPQGHPFTNAMGTYWSSTTYAPSTDIALTVNSYTGRVGISYLNYEGVSTPYYKFKTIFVWPVRAGQCGALGDSVICLPKTGQTSCYNYPGTPAPCTGTGQDGDIQAGVAWPSPRFVDNGETVTDSLTGLEWTKNANLAGGKKSWQAALDYVKTLTTGGHGDWRLPNERELRSLADYSKYNPALPQGHPFTNVQSYGYWSSTSCAYGTGSAWSVSMYSGEEGYGYKSIEDYVWPVRAGQMGNSGTSTTTTSVQPTTTTSVAPATTTTTAPVDTDRDGIADTIDNCPAKYNPQQHDANNNGIGDVCDATPGCGGCGQSACEQYADTDGDGSPDVIDNCPNTYNPQQRNADSDGIGDCCDATPGCGGCGQVACDTVCTL